MEKVSWIFDKASERFDWYVLRSSFDADAETDIVADVTALGSYQLYINGQFVSRGPTASYAFNRLYDSADISPFVKKGRNQVVIVSQHIEFGGVFVRISLGGNVICQSDKAWKIKKYEAFDTKTLANAAPLEPFCRCEEHFNAAEDCGILENNYDYSSWKSADVIRFPDSFVSKSSGGCLTREIKYPEAVMAAASLRLKKGISGRLHLNVRNPGKITKMLCEVYMAYASADKAFKAKAIVGGCQMWVNGERAAEEVSFKAGLNRIVCICQAPNSQPQFFFETDEKLNFIENEHNGQKAAWWVKELEINDQTFGWAYLPTEKYANPKEAEEFINAAKHAEAFCEFEENYEIKKAGMLDLSVSFMNRIYERGFVSGGFCDPSLKLTMQFEDNGFISNTKAMLSGNAEYAEASGDSAFIFDFGIMQLGYVSFRVFAEEGTVIETEGFELIDSTGIRYTGKGCMRYVCRGGWQEFTSFYPVGFRYLSFVVRNTAGPVKIGYISVEKSVAMTEGKGDFSCDDMLINSIYQMSVDTALLCMSDTYVDCPGYELVYWVGDAKVTSHVNCVNFGAYDYDLKCLEMIAQSMTEEYRNFYESDNPAYAENKNLLRPAFGTYVNGGLPVWSFLWMMQVYDYYLYSGNISGLERLFPAAEKMLSNCEKMMSGRGLFAMEGAWNLIEWSVNDLLPCGEVTVNSAMLSKCYALFSELAGALGKASLSENYAEKSKRIKDAVNKYCWNEEAKAYSDSVRDEFGYGLYCEFFGKQGIECVNFNVFQKYERISEQTNTLVYICDCVPKEREESVKSIIRRIENKDYVHRNGSPKDNTAAVNKGEYHNLSDISGIGSPFFLYFTFRALSKMGDYNEMLDVMRREYSIILEHGSNTCWECFYNPGSDFWTRSVCHAWGASPAVYLIADVCGIKPTKPGFKEFSFNPNIADIRKIKTSVPTPYGRIFVNIDKDKELCDIDYPRECTMV